MQVAKRSRVTKVARLGSFDMHDIVIRGGTIIDGTGRAAFSGDVAIAGRSDRCGRRQSKDLLGARSMPRG